MMRSSLLEEMGKDYVDAARAVGSENPVVRRHARRNAFFPTITWSACDRDHVRRHRGGGDHLRLAGLGSWMAASVLSGDQGTTLAFVIFTSILFLIVNLVVDVLYGTSTVVSFEEDLAMWFSAVRAERASGAFVRVAVQGQVGDWPRPRERFQQGEHEVWRS